MFYLLFYKFYLFIYLFIYLWLCWVFVSVRGLSLVAASGPLTIGAPLVAEHRLQTRRLSSCGSRAQLLRGMWEPPRPGLEPVSPALAGGLSTTVPPGKPCCVCFNSDFDFSAVEKFVIFPHQYQCDRYENYREFCFFLFNHIHLEILFILQVFPTF